MTIRSGLRPLKVLLVVVLSAGLLAGCGKRETQEAEVLEAIAATRLGASQFVYTDQRVDKKVQVSGLIEDDFRFKAQVSVNGNPAYEQVVLDDALAMRFLTPERLKDYLSPNVVNADFTTELEGVTSLEALRSRRWVTDPTGAPLLVANARTLADIGSDPVYDAITVLDYIENAMRQAEGVVKYNPDSISPTYPSSEDVFPVPEDGSGVDRYDLARPNLPAVSSAGGNQGETAFPDAAHFRKMAIYVKDGRVVEVIEAIEATGKRLEALDDYIKSALREGNVPDEFRTAFEEFIKEIDDPSELADALFLGLNNALVTFGEDPVITRRMSVSFPEETSISNVELPTENVISGSLAAMAASAEAQEFLLSGGAEEEETGGADPGGGADAEGTTEESDDGTGGDGGSGDGSDGGDVPTNAEVSE